MYYKLLFFSLLLSFSTMSVAQTQFNFVDDEETTKTKKSDKMTKKSGKVSNSTESLESRSSSSELSSEWDLESITQEVETLESDLKGAKNSDAEFNDIRVLKIQLSEKKEDLEKAKLIEEYKEENKAEVIENGPEYLKQVHDFVNATIHERYGNLKTPKIEQQKKSAYSELMNHILEDKVLKCRVSIRPESPEWNKRFEKDELVVELISVVPAEDARKKPWRIWFRTNTEDAINEKDGLSVRNYDSFRSKGFILEGAISEVINEEDEDEGGFVIKDWRMFEFNKEEK
jgi:hypothetical protein